QTLLGFSLAEIKQTLQVDARRAEVREAYVGTTEPAVRQDLLDQASALIQSQIRVIDERMGRLAKLREDHMDRLSRIRALQGGVMAYWRLNAGLVKTDNAQTGGDLAPVSAQISGIVTRIDVTDNQYVKSGTVLVELDPTDYRLALDQAKANLAAAEAQVRVAEATLADQENQYRTGV